MGPDQFARPTHRLGAQLPRSWRISWSAQLNLLSALNFDPLHLDVGLRPQLLGDALGVDAASSVMCLASALASATRSAWNLSASASRWAAFALSSS